MSPASRPRPVVLDTSVAIAWLLQDEPLRAAALGIADSIRSGALEPIVASNFGFELRHSLVRSARRERIGWELIPQALASIERLRLATPPIGYPDESLLELCRTQRVTWGDAHHAWLALRSARPLVTADQRLVRALDGSGIWVAHLGDLRLD